MKPITATLGYVIRGVAYDKQNRQALVEELQENLEHASAVTALPVVDGISLELEVSDIAPFSSDSFEPYIAEHVLGPAVRSKCESYDSDVELRLINKRFH